MTKRELENAPHLTFIGKWTIFGLGVAGVVHATFFSDAERPSLLILYAAMMGLPAFVGFDNWIGKTRKNAETEGEPKKEGTT